MTGATTPGTELQGQQAQAPSLALKQVRQLAISGALVQDCKADAPNGTIGQAEQGAPDLTRRSLAWKVMLGVKHLPSQEYLELVEKGPSLAHEKICNDAFRTLTTDTSFRARVTEEQLIRLLDAFVWSHTEDEQVAKDAESGYEFTYVQGMNVLAAPFLCAMPTEIEAFYCFKRFLEAVCPLYVQPTLTGVHSGLRLMDECLQVIDPELARFLADKSLPAEIYAFPSVLTFCACTPPLEQVMPLWDFLLAFGVHLNVVCIISQLLAMRAELLGSPSEGGEKAHSNPYSLLRVLPDLRAKEIIERAVEECKKLPDELYSRLAAHPYETRL